MKNGLTKFATTLAFMTAVWGVNDNKIQAQQNARPGGFTPQARTIPVKTAADSAQNDTVIVNFNALNTDEDTAKKAISPDMPLDDQAAIYSRNNPAVGIAIFKGKDMAKYTDKQMIDFYEGICRDSGVVGKVFIGPGYVPDGGTVYAVFVEGGSVGGILDGSNILSDKGLPRATMIRKGYDNRIKRASMDLTQQ